MPIVGSFAGASARAYGLGAGGVAIGDFESIQTINVTTNVASVEFTSIPQTFTHLQLRAFARVNSGDSYQLLAQMNSDTGANYAYHYIYGASSGAASGGGFNQTYMSLGSQPGASTSGANIFGASVCDILDYTNTNKFKTSRAISGASRQSTPSYIFLPSAHWRNTAAITSIKLFSEGAASFVQYSSFALYGVKA
jgi:hypothetical protein